jgi:hypothetical protein
MGVKDLELLADSATATMTKCPTINKTATVTLISCCTLTLSLWIDVLFDGNDDNEERA